MIDDVIEDTVYQVDKHGLGNEIERLEGLVRHLRRDWEDTCAQIETLTRRRDRLEEIHADNVRMLKILNKVEDRERKET